ncbi:MAG TPA: ABC transporter ATP-binding protein [Gemmataceae bacterium]|jgi:ABC-type multidrug transport system fused ATPase/permease subunit
MDRQSEQAAFAKACAYLNYQQGAKWTAHIAAAGTGLVYVALLIVLWLFTDLLVYRGQLPTLHTLTPLQQNRFRGEWNQLPAEERHQRLQALGYLTQDQIQRLAAMQLEPDISSETVRSDVRYIWYAQVRHILSEKLGAESLPERDDYNANVGITSLLVRSQTEGRIYAPVVSKLAKWAPWTRNPNPRRSGIISSYLIGLLLIGVLLALLGATLMLLMREMAARASIEAATRLRRAVYHHTFRLGTLAFRALGPTEAVSIFARHIEAVHDALFTHLTVSYRAPIKFALLIAFALLVQFWLALASLVLAILVWLIGGQMAAYFRRRGRQATHLASEYLTIMRESLMLMRLVKCYLLEQFNQNRVERQLSRYSRVQLIRLRGEALYQPLLVLFGLLCALLLLFVAGILVLSGQLTVASLVALSTALVSLYQPLQSWLEARKLVRRGRDSADNVFKFLERRGEVGQVVGAEFLPPLHKQIEFDSVSLREPGSNRMLLQDVSLTIPAGKRIGLIGSDDLEKHALVYLIPRLLDPTSGEIRIDQHNLRWVTLDSLRAQISIVLTHNLVFHDTVANNIGCGDNAYTLGQIIDAAKLAHAHHFIQKLSKGYETPIGELGHSLSISEQFRIALARAVLRDPALLIVEEPETALDEETKALLDDTWTRVLPGRTVIFLPHRISTIRSCDTLFLLHKGRIVASGVHKELLAQNPLYRHLHYLEFNEMVEQIQA